MKTFSILLALAVSATAALAQTAPVTVTGAWARASVQGQSGTGAFMALTASEPLTLVGAASPAAGVTALHEMKLEGDVMRMRSVSALQLPASQTVQLKPGGYHLMLQDLKAPLVPGSSVPVTLTFRNSRGQQSRLDLNVPVSAAAPAGAAPAASLHKH